MDVLNPGCVPQSGMGTHEDRLGGLLTPGVKKTPLPVFEPFQAHIEQELASLRAQVRGLEQALVQSRVPGLGMALQVPWRQSVQKTPLSEFVQYQLALSDHLAKMDAQTADAIQDVHEEMLLRIKDVVAGFQIHLNSVDRDNTQVNRSLLALEGRVKMLEARRV